MKSALFGAAFSALFFSGFGANAQAFPDNGVFDKWLNASAAECVPVSDFAPVAAVTELSPEQFQFVRAVFVTLPPVSQKLPPGDHAVIAKAGGLAMLALVDGGQACARFLAPAFILSMLDQVGSQTYAHSGTPAVYWREIAEPPALRF
jgi:hypothetical protein